MKNRFDKIELEVVVFEATDNIVCSWGDDPLYDDPNKPTTPTP